MFHLHNHQHHHYHYHLTITITVTIKITITIITVLTIIMHLQLLHTMFHLLAVPCVVLGFMAAFDYHQVIIFTSSS